MKINISMVFLVGFFVLLFTACPNTGELQEPKAGPFDVKIFPDNETIEVNPPVFVWRPIEGATSYHVKIWQSALPNCVTEASASSFSNITLNYFPPPITPLAQGYWCWRYSPNGSLWSKARSFTVPSQTYAIKYADLDNLPVKEHPILTPTITITEQNQLLDKFNIVDNCKKFPTSYTIFNGEVVSYTLNDQNKYRCVVNRNAVPLVKTECEKSLFSEKSGGYCFDPVQGWFGPTQADIPERCQTTEMSGTCSSSMADRAVQKAVGTLLSYSNLCSTLLGNDPDLINEVSNLITNDTHASLNIVEEIAGTAPYGKYSLSTIKYNINNCEPLTSIIIKSSTKHIPACITAVKSLVAYAEKWDSKVIDPGSGKIYYPWTMFGHPCIDDLDAMYTLTALIESFDLLYQLLSATDRELILKSIIRRTEVFYNSVLGEKFHLRPSVWYHREQHVHRLFQIGLLLYNENYNVCLEDGMAANCSGNLINAQNYAKKLLRYTLPFLYSTNSPAQATDDGAFILGSYYGTAATNYLLTSSQLFHNATSGSLTLFKPVYSRIADYFAYTIPSGVTMNTFGSGSEFHPEPDTMETLLEALNNLAPVASPYKNPANHYASTTLPNNKFFDKHGLVVWNKNRTTPMENVFFRFKSSSMGSNGQAHADQNSFLVDVNGWPVLIDSGYYCHRFKYNDNSHHTNWTIKTRAHNTITIDGQIGQSWGKTIPLDTVLPVFDDIQQLYSFVANNFVRGSNRVKTHQMCENQNLEFCNEEGAEATGIFNMQKNALGFNYLRADASQAYDRINFERSILNFADTNNFLIFDKLSSKDGAPHRFEFNLHGWNTPADLGNGEFKFQGAEGFIYNASDSPYYSEVPKEVFANVKFLNPSNLSYTLTDQFTITREGSNDVINATSCEIGPDRTSQGHLQAYTPSMNEARIFTFINAYGDAVEKTDIVSSEWVSNGYRPVDSQDFVSGGMNLLFLKTKTTGSPNVFDKLYIIGFNTILKPFFSNFVKAPITKKVSSDGELFVLEYNSNLQPLRGFIPGGTFLTIDNVNKWSCSNGLCTPPSM